MSTIKPYNDPNRPREMLDPALAEAALSRIRNAANGNGIDPRTISITHLDGEVFHFEGRSLFEIKTTLVEKTLPGRETQGEVCASAADLRTRIQKTIASVTVDPALVAIASDMLEKRKDKGFCVNDLILKLDRMNKVFVFYSPCSSCGGGKTNCGTCHGAGQTNCVRCNGHRTIRCPMCRGTRVSRQKDGKMGTCRKCNGHGESQCTFCHATGKTRCATCKGTGHAACQKCHATGVISDIGYVTFEGKTHYTFDPEPLPPELPKLILQSGPGLIAGQHADIAILRQQDHDAARKTLETKDKNEVKDELVVPHYLRLPYGDIAFQIADGPELKGKIFGLRPRLINLPPFLEAPIAPGIECMKQAAGNHDVQTNIDNAIRFRVLGDALIAAATLPVKKAALQMRQKWALGIRPGTSDQIVLHAASAFSNMTKKPRLIGVFAGLLIMCLVDILYLTLARPTLTLHPFALMALDVVLVAGGAYMGIIASQIMIAHSVRGVFAKILPPDQARKIIPRAGSVVVLAGAGSVLVFIVVVLSLFAAGQTIPSWATMMLKAIFP